MRAADRLRLKDAEVPVREAVQHRRSRLAVGRAIREARARGLAEPFVASAVAAVTAPRADRRRLLLGAIVALLLLLLLLFIIVTQAGAKPTVEGGGGDTAPSAVAAVQTVGEGSRGRSSVNSTPPPVVVAIIQPTTEVETAPAAAIAPVGAPSNGSGTRAGGGGSGGGTGTGSGPGVGSGSGPGTGNGTPAPAPATPAPTPPPPPLRTSPPFFAPPALNLAPVRAGFTRVIFYVADDDTSAWVQGVCVGYDFPDCGSAGSRTDGYGRFYADLYPDQSHQFWNFQFLMPGYQPVTIRVNQRAGQTTIIPVRIAKNP